MTENEKVKKAGATEKGGIRRTLDLTKTRFQVNGDFILREIAGEAVLVPTGENTPLAGTMIQMNPTAVFLWKYFAVPHLVSDAVAEAVDQFDGDRNEITRDIVRFVLEGPPLGMVRAEERKDSDEPAQMKTTAPETKETEGKCR